MTITHAKWERPRLVVDGDGKAILDPEGNEQFISAITAGPIEGQTWSGITEASNFWPMVQAWVDAGNVIEPYVEPAPENPLDKPLPRLAFWLVAASAGVSKWSVRDRIEEMPDASPEEFQAKAEAIAWFEEAKQYRRYDPILVAQAAAEGITSEQLDALWTYAVL